MVDMILCGVACKEDNKGLSHYAIHYYNCPTEEDESNVIEFRKECARVECTLIEARKIAQADKNFEFCKELKPHINDMQQYIKVCNLLLTDFFDKTVRIPLELESAFILVNACINKDV